jgi:hypothetical protein
MIHRIVAAAGAALLLSGVANAAAAPTCDRVCLYQVLDRYLAALKAGDATKAGFAPGARTSENNVMLRPGDGCGSPIRKPAASPSTAWCAKPIPQPPSPCG